MNGLPWHKCIHGEYEYKRRALRPLLRDTGKAASRLVAFGYTVATLPGSLFVIGGDAPLRVGPSNFREHDRAPLRGRCLLAGRKHQHGNHSGSEHRKSPSTGVSIGCQADSIKRFAGSKLSAGLNGGRAVRKHRPFYPAGAVIGALLLPPC